MSFKHLQKKIMKKKWNLFDSSRIRSRIPNRIRIRYPGSGSSSKWSGSETLAITACTTYYVHVRVLD